MPRVRNPGSGKPPYNGKARGGPASGAGWGGPAKGLPVQPPITAETQPSPEAKQAGHEVAAAIRARIAARKEELVDAQFARALNPKHPQGHAAAADLLDRIAPKTAKVEATLRGVPADDMTDEELAAIACRGSRGAADPTPDQG